MNTMDVIIDPETQPLLAQLNDDATKVSDAVATSKLIDFHHEGDQENPLEWTGTYKGVVVGILASMAFTVTFTCIGLVPVADRIITDLNGGIEDKSSAILLVTVWELGEAIGPLLIAPLSEIYGRTPIFNAANFLFIFAVLLAVTSQSVHLFIFARFLTGISVAGNVLNPAIVGDIFSPEERGKGMSAISFAPLLGSAVGPAISGIIAETWGWRSVLWMALLLSVACEISMYFGLRETYKITILRRRAKKLRLESGDESIKCVYDDGHEKSFWHELRVGIQRPVRLFWSSTVLQLLSVYGTLEFTFYYVMATTLPGFLRETYNLSPASIGYCFMSFTLGAILGVLFSNAFLDRIYIRLSHRHKSNPGTGQPEDRLPILLIGGVLFPFMIVLYGLTPYLNWPLSILLFSVLLLGFLLCSVSISLSAYVIDAFGLYSASAMTSVLILRCLGGTFLPMTIPPLVDAVGVGYAYLLQAGICLVFLPLPVLVFRYGRHWREKSVYTRG